MVAQCEEHVRPELVNEMRWGVNPHKRHFLSREEDPFVFSDDERPQKRTNPHKGKPTSDDDEEGERERGGPEGLNFDEMTEKWKHRRISHIDLEHTRSEARETLTTAGRPWLQHDGDDHDVGFQSSGARTEWIPWN